MVEYKKENKERKRGEYFRELTNFKKILLASDYNQLFLQPETIDILCQMPITYTTTKIMPQSQNVWGRLPITYYNISFYDRIIKILQKKKTREN